MLNNAKKYKADSYARCSSVGSIKKAIYNANGAIMSLNIFTNRENCDIIIAPNELNNRTDRYIFLYGITIPFLRIS